MVHANAPLTEKHRLRLARLIVDDGLPVAQAAQRFQVAWPTAKRWAERYRNLGPAGMGDRSSRPHHSPTRTRPGQVRAIVRDRIRLRLGPIEIDEKATTAVGVLTRATAWFARRGVTVSRVLSDNGSAYRSHLWRDTCHDLGITPKRTRPYRPQTNGKIVSTTA